MAKFCSECGESVAAKAKFCASCGHVLTASSGKDDGDKADATQPAPVAAVPEVGASASEPGPRGSNTKLLVGGAIVVIVLLVAGLAVALGGGGGDETERVVASKKPPETTTTTRDPAEVRAEAEFLGFLEKTENILHQSAGGRGQVGRLVSGVENGCSIDPYDASQQIQVVIDNRTTILNQLAALNVPPDPAAQNVHSILQRALQSSIDADIQYKAWFNYLYNDYYYIYPVGCPNGSPPKDSAFAAARSADANSSSLKQQFVDAFNPIAFGFGLRTWTATEF